MLFANVCAGVFLFLVRSWWGKGVFWLFCLKNECMTDVHMTSPHDDHYHDHDNDHLHDTTTRVGALVAHHPG